MSSGGGKHNTEREREREDEKKHIPSVSGHCASERLLVSTFAGRRLSTFPYSNLVNELEYYRLVSYVKADLVEDSVQRFDCRSLVVSLNPYKPRVVCFGRCPLMYSLTI